MFNNNINKPAITVFLPLTSAKTSFCQWQNLVFAGKNYFCRDGFFRGKKRFLPVTGKNLPTLTVASALPTLSHTGAETIYSWVYIRQHQCSVGRSEHTHGNATSIHGDMNYHISLFLA